MCRKCVRRLANTKPLLGARRPTGKKLGGMFTVSVLWVCAEVCGSARRRRGLRREVRILSVGVGTATFQAEGTSRAKSEDESARDDIAGTLGQLLCLSPFGLS